MERSHRGVGAGDREPQDRGSPDSSAAFRSTCCGRRRRSCAASRLYKPFRFFLTIGAVPFVIGLALLVRWLLIYAFADDYQSRVPSLLAGIGLLLLAVQVWSVAFLADLLSSNRRTLAELRLRSKRLEYGDVGPPPSGDATGSDRRCR